MNMRARVRRLDLRRRLGLHPDCIEHTLPPGPRPLLEWKGPGEPPADLLPPHCSCPRCRRIPILIRPALPGDE